jgi:hypothetical protein
MTLRSIAVSTANYQILRNLGKAGDNFNDVITGSIKKAGTIEDFLDNDNEKLQYDCGFATSCHTVVTTNH